MGDEVRASEHTTPEASDLYQAVRGWSGGGVYGGGDGDVEPCARAGAGVGGAGGCGDVYEPDAGSSGLSRDDGARMRRRRRSCLRGWGRGHRSSRVCECRRLRYGDSSCWGCTAGFEAVRWGHLGWMGTVQYRAEARNIRFGAGLDGSSSGWTTPSGGVEIFSPLSGRVNIYNLLAASCAALARGLTLEQIAAAAKEPGAGAGAV